MKQVKLFFSVILFLLFIVFTFQNFENVTISFFKWSITLPLAITALGLYVLGMLTGGLLWSGLKKLTKKAEL